MAQGSPNAISVTGAGAPDGGGLLFYGEGKTDRVITYNMITNSGQYYIVSCDRQYNTVETHLAGMFVPSVTADDNGKILKVENGLWKLRENTSLPIPATAQAGQIIKVKSVDDSGNITETEAVDMPSEEKWEIIKTIDIADGTAETTALTIDTDNNGNAFSLKKCRLFARFPAYKGETTIPNFSFTMINNGMTGDHSPLCYTSGFPKLRTDGYSGTVWEVDVSGLQQYEKVMRTSSTTWPANVYGSINNQTTEYWGDKRIQYITSIGGAQMLIFPGCHFELHGVRE